MSSSIPPSKDEAIEILKGLRDRYEAHHRVQITDEALKSAVDLSDRYISGRCLPDKAIDVIDEAGARIRLKAMTRPPDLKDIDDAVEEAQHRERIRRRRAGLRKGRVTAGPGRQAPQEKRDADQRVAREGQGNRRRGRRRGRLPKSSPR